jgi:hypothetical protein
MIAKHLNGELFSGLFKDYLKRKELNTMFKNENKKENKLTGAIVVQQFSPAYYIGWNPTEKQAVEDENIKTIAETIKSKLEKAGCEIEAMYIIKHDKDIYKFWDETTSKYAEAYKPNHFHLLIVFKSGKGATLSSISAYIGIEKQYIEKPGRGKYSLDNLYSYLIHIKYTDRHQYSFNEVLTICGKPYSEIYVERKFDWEKGRGKLLSTKAKADIDWLEMQILDGTVTEQQVMLTDEYYKIYAKYTKRCTDSFNAYAKRKMLKNMQEFINENFISTTFFIVGSSRNGKSYFAKDFINCIISERKERTGELWTCYNAASVG